MVDISEGEVPISVQEIDFLIVIKVLFLKEGRSDNPALIRRRMKRDLTDKRLVLYFEFSMKISFAVLILKRETIVFPLLLY